MSTLSFDQAITQIKTSSLNGDVIELYCPSSNTHKQIALWQADIALVENRGIVMVGGLRFRNNGACAVEMR